MHIIINLKLNIEMDDDALDMWDNHYMVLMEVYRFACHGIKVEVQTLPDILLPGSFFDSSWQKPLSARKSSMRGEVTHHSVPPGTQTLLRQGEKWERAGQSPSHSRHP